LSSVPWHLRTPAICEAAVRQDGWAMVYVPREMHHAGLYLACVPEAFRSAEACWTAVSEDAWALEHVPQALKSADLCRLAVWLCDETQQLVSDGLKDEDIVQGGCEGRQPDLCLGAGQDLDGSLQPGSRRELWTPPRARARLFEDAGRLPCRRQAKRPCARLRD
jgi:hypothetical protein